MSKLGGKRLLGPINTVMGGDQSGTGGGGGSSLNITNNVDGYLLKATGEANRIEGIPNLKWDGARNALTASADVYVSGSNNYLYLHGSDADGKTVRFRVSLSGSILKVDPDNPEGTI